MWFELITTFPEFTVQLQPSKLSVELKSPLNTNSLFAAGALDHDPLYVADSTVNVTVSVFSQLPNVDVAV